MNDSFIELKQGRERIVQMKRIKVLREFGKMGNIGGGESTL